MDAEAPSSQTGLLSYAAAKGPDVVAVIVAHQSTSVLSQCLTAFARAAARVDARAIVVDSGSTDDPAAICDRLGVPLLRVPNRGLGAAFNRALEREEVRCARYVLQLNPDVELPAGGLDALVAHADRRPHCGVLGPRQVDQNGELIFSIGIEPSPAGCWRAANPSEPPWAWSWDRERYRSECDADWVMGACLLLRGAMLAQIGGFDEQFFLCSEEVDLCRRAREAGWSVGYVPNVTVVHPLAGRAPDPHRLRLEEWSWIVYLRKWQGWRARCSIRLAIAVRLALLAALEVRHPRAQRSSRIRLGATLRFRRRGYGPAAPWPDRAPDHERSAFPPADTDATGL